MSRIWEVSIIVDPSCEPGIVSSLCQYMPLWIVDTPGNSSSITAARLEKRDCTSFKVLDGSNRIGNLLSSFDTLDLHHPSMTCLHIVGVESSVTLTAKLAECGFIPARNTWSEAIAFRRRQVDWSDSPVLRLKAADWRTSGDVYDSLFEALQSPPWHGRNFNALDDSIMTGQINQIEPPYRLLIEGLERAAPNAKTFTKELMRLFKEFEERGCPISVEGDDTFPRTEEVTLR